jgi:exopolyphosphatase/guanosine-5'-triphosphate,3'-diphosphate pyrophosphatase
MQPDERLAVIDLGSNSFRLVVFTAADGWWKRTDEIYEPVRIGEGLAASGGLGEGPMRRALATLDVFAHFCRAAGLTQPSGPCAPPIRGPLELRSGARSMRSRRARSATPRMRRSSSRAHVS